MKKRKVFTHVIITDEDKKPMAWSETNKQLVYCTDWSWQDEHTPVEVYTIAKATRLIEKSKRNRKRWKARPFKYKTMPFLMPRKRTYESKENR